METKDYIRLVEQDPKYDKIFDNFGDDMIFLCVSGSRAYGCATENSDIDIRGVCLNNRNDILNIKDRHTTSFSDSDTTIYPLKQFFKLLLDGNMSAIELLNQRYVLYQHPVFSEIVSAKDYFLSNRCYNRSVGYIYGILRKVKKTVRQFEDGTIHKNDFYKKISKKISTAHRVAKTTEYLLRTGNVMVYDEQLSKELMEIRNTNYEPNEDFDSIFKELIGLCDNALEVSVLQEFPDEEEAWGIFEEIVLYTINRATQKDENRFTNCLRKVVSNEK